MFDLFKKKNECSDGHFVCIKQPYLGDSLRKQAGRIMDSLKKGEDLGGICLMILSTGASDQLDLVRSDYLLQPYYRSQPITVVGMASGESEAKIVLLRMMQRCYNERHDADLRSFLEEQVRREGYME